MLLMSIEKTPMGNLYLVSDGEYLLGAGFRSHADLLRRISPEDQAESRRNVSKIPVVTSAVRNYFDGELDAFNSLLCRQPGGDFYQAVWKAMRKIKAGSTYSYGELAKRAGNARASRAAGTACATNLIAPIIPCHRVVRAGGELGNYGFGLGKKEWILRFEGAIG